MGSGENLSRSSNELSNENDESVNVCFDDARELPDSKIPPLKISSLLNMLHCKTSCRYSR